VVALLCLTALGLLLKNVLHLGGNENLAGSTPGPVIRPLLASVAPVPSPAESSATTVSPPSIERDDHLQSLTNRWMHPGRRDPFGAQYDSQRQAVNVQDFTVEKIEPDRVWVTGPNGREELSFKVHPVELSSRSRQEPQR
jgi:hypothetical protein